MTAHSVWRRLRGPFRSLHCAVHNWERYDYHMAGCLDCGCAHECSATLAESSCPLAHPYDGSVCCTITGFSLPIVRYCANEYVDHNVKPADRPHEQNAVELLSDEVHGIVEWFLMGGTSIECKRDEVHRTLVRFQSVVVKELKQHKMDTAGDKKKCLPCLPTIIARTIHQIHPKHSRRATESLCKFCSQHITRCIINLEMTTAQNKRTCLVVGLLYLMKQGLTIQNVQWLPRVPSLADCLPHETCLEKTFKLSMKLVCETENEVKLALRHRVKLL